MNLNQKKNLKNILKNLEIKKGNNIYLGLDFFKFYKLLDIKKANHYEIVDQILKFFLSYLGKKGNLVIPVFNFDCIKKKKFDITKSPGQSGLLGNILLKNYSNFRTNHPIYSFLCFGNESKKYKKIVCSNATAKNSIWKYFIEDKFDLVTLGHHYSRSITLIHYLENLLSVDYRFNLKFSINYKNRRNNTYKKNYSFFARNTDICEFSGMTKNCDRIFLKKKITKFYKYKNLISFKLKIKEASALFYEDLKKNSQNLISYIKPNEENKDVLETKITIPNLEKYYCNYKKNNLGKKILI
jgi:aminoglycoside N3'-acetyltransferase